MLICATRTHAGNIPSVRTIDPTSSEPSSHGPEPAKQSPLQTLNARRPGTIPRVPKLFRSTRLWAPPVSAEAGARR